MTTTKMRTQVKPGFKRFMRILFGLAVVAVAVWVFLTYVQPMISGKGDKIALNGWAGFAGITQANGGMITTPDSYIGKEGGYCEILQIDSRNDAINALINDEVLAIWNTTDVFPTEIGSASNLAGLEVVQYFKIDDSRGADKVVVRPEIRKISDLKGKSVVFGRATASNTLLIVMLESAGMTMADIVPMEVNDGIEASQAYQAGTADCAVVWSPDDGDCISAIPGTWVIFSTEEATSIIMDGLITKKSTLEDKRKRENLAKIARGILLAHADMNKSQAARDAAAASFAAAFKVPVDIVNDGVAKVHFSTYGDNLAFFGLDPTYTGVTGADLYNKMANLYSSLKDTKGMLLADNPLPWIKVSDTRIIEELSDMKNLSGQEVEGQVNFASAPSDYVAIAERSVTINFETNSSILTESNKSIIDFEIGDRAKELGGARFEIAGNTDDVGCATESGRAYNKKLSLDRAQSVVDYLIKRYKFDPDKFVVVGNGPDDPIASNTTEAGRAANRRTDVKIIVGR